MNKGALSPSQLFIVLALICILAGTVLAETTNEVYFGFESGELEGWRVVEGEFGMLVCDRSEFHNTREPYNNHGTYFLSTLEQNDYRPNDRFTGVIESPVFELHAPEISFLVGGGNHADTYVALCTLDGQEHLTAHGANSEVMQEVTWHATDLVGQRCFVRIVDKNEGGWGHVTFDHFRAQGQLDPKATAAHFAHLDTARLREAIAAELDACTFEALGNAIAGLAERYGESIPDAEELLTETAELVRTADEIRAAPPDESALERAGELRRAFEALQRRALLSHPVLREHPILFVTRRQYRVDHHNTATMFQVGEINVGSFEGGGALKTIHFGRGGAVETLLEAPEGIIRDPEVHFDGERIVFSMRKNRAGAYNIYEIRNDGSGLRQLTHAERVSDIDPLYLPDDSIVFSSTREPKYCMCNRHIMANLFRMDADGANIHQIGRSTLFEGHPALLPDGRIIYDRWEYVDRNFGDAQGLWTVNPDGTNHALYWGNNTWSPGAVLYARPIPGTQQVICIFTSCHDRPWGALAIIDRRLGLDNREPVIQIWPPEAIELVGPGDPDRPDHYGFDLFMDVYPKYEDPFPLDDAFFLCSRLAGPNELMGLFLVDIFGNEMLLHVEEPGCYDPMPIAPWERPPMIPSRRTFEEESGALYVMDVYEGTHMEGVVPGSVKYLRVVESPEKQSWTSPGWEGQGQQAPAMNWHDFNNKRILGTVPVEPDGSAYFEVPADTFVYFQLLDERGMMVQSMRSGTIVQSGEVTGCVGCHEERRKAPPTLSYSSSVPLALQREVDALQGWKGEPRFFSYIEEVQPVFDRHCVECHDYGKEAGEKLLLCGDKTIAFNTSYKELWRKGYIKAIGAGPADIQQPYSWGAHPSPLVQTILEGHHDVQLDDECFERLVTWIDINAPYYPLYSSAFPHNLAGRSPLNNTQLERLEELTGIPFRQLADHRRNRGPLVSFDRPELSPCLRGLDDAAYAEALSIIQAGKAVLAQTPRADMPGYRPSEPDRLREEHYQLRAEEEHRMREALAHGNRAYEHTGRP